MKINEMLIQGRLDDGGRTLITHDCVALQKYPPGSLNSQPGLLTSSDTSASVPQTVFPSAAHLCAAVAYVIRSLLNSCRHNPEVLVVEEQQALSAAAMRGSTHMGALD